MIEEKKPVHIRLVNGDELIAEWVQSSSKSIIVKKPMVVTETQDPNTSLTNVVLSKYILFNNEEEIEFDRNHVITCTDVIKEIGEFYYNSLELSMKYIEPKIINDIAKSNVNMRNFLDSKEDKQDTVISNNSKVIYFPNSNTIH